jgi:CrcB protein
MDEFFWVVIGSALGGAGRFWLSGFVGRRIGETFPWGTIAVNVSGCFAIGVLGAIARSAPPWFHEPIAWPVAVIGFLGCYTTVSSFSLQTLMLARDGETLRAVGNVALSVVLCLAAVAAGYMTGSALGAAPG